MIPLYQDPFYTFRFAEDRLVPRFHLEGISPGQRVTVFSANPSTLQPIGWLSAGVVGAGGWVDLPRALVVRAGEAFVVFPEIAENTVS